MEALVFIGRDLEPGDVGQVYFQDIDSYRRGVRYGAASENDGARFSCGLELELASFFEFDSALEELVQCSVRRRERQGAQVEGFPAAMPPLTRLDEVPTQSLRFDDEELQEQFIAELRKTALAFDIATDGAVVFAAADWPLLLTVVHTIRDRCFRWYLIWWKGLGPASRFWHEMKISGLPFRVEFHDGQMVFLLPKGSEDLHEAIIKRLQEVDLAEARTPYGTLKG